MRNTTKSTIQDMNTPQSKNPHVVQPPRVHRHYACHGGRLGRQPRPAGRRARTSRHSRARGEPGASAAAQSAHGGGHTDAQSGQDRFPGWHLQPRLPGGDQQPDTAKLSVEIMNRAIDLGVNYFDTSHAYGDGRSETHVGLVMKDRATRCFWLKDGAARLRRRNEGSRHELQKRMHRSS